VLCGYSFPGNVRELENVIERALALCSDGLISEQDLQLAPVASEQNSATSTLPSGRYALTEYLDQVERKALLAALDKTHFNRTAAAKLLGLTFRTMRYRMERLGIKPPEGHDDES
jgi:two-component system response regulator PilR (NtrC family)